MGRFSQFKWAFKNAPVSKPEIRKARFAKDFGTGFYCTEILEQAKRWARRFDSPIFSHYEYRETQGLNILNFSEMTEEWLDFIVAGPMLHYNSRSDCLLQS
jgi:hypothetical protein